jgi:hypothetical protein
MLVLSRISVCLFLYCFILLLLDALIKDYLRYPEFFVVLICSVDCTWTLLETARNIVPF